jgi:hypothetical protein
MEGVHGSIEMQIVHIKDSTYSSTSNSALTDHEQTTNTLIISIIFIRKRQGNSSILRSFKNFIDISNLNFNSLLNGDFSSTLPNITESLVEDKSETAYKYLDLNKVVQINKKMIYYKGSSTSFTCESNVHWLIQDYYYPASASDVDLISNYINSVFQYGNAKNVKSLGARNLYMFTKENIKLNIVFNNAFFLTFSVPFFSVLLAIFLF